MPLNVIIIAAVALIVLIIIVIFFSGRMGRFSSSLEDCQSKGGTLITEDEECPKTDSAKIPVKDETYKYCCLDVLG